MAAIDRLIENDLDRHTLHNFHEIPGCVFRRKKTEARAAAGLNAVYVAAQDVTGIGVHSNFRRLPRSHLS